MKLWTEKNSWQSKKSASKLAQLDPTHIREIVVIKHAAFGDMLLLRPFLIELRKAFPQAKITLSVRGQNQRGLPEDLIDRVHIVPSNNEKKGFWRSLQVYKELGPQDLLFDLTASTRSIVISLITRARFKIGFQYRNLHKFIYDVAIPRSAYRFEAGTFLEQLCPLGIDYDWPPAFDMKISPARRDRPYIVYFPTASIPEKTWPADNFTILIRNTAAEYPDFDHIILSGIAEWEISAAANIMTSLSEIENIILMQAGPDDQALIQGADLLVSNDTGIRHLGIALNTTTVCIFSNTPPYRYWPRYGHHQVVYNQDGSMPDWKPVGLAINKAMAEKLG